MELGKQGLLFLLDKKCGTATTAATFVAKIADCDEHLQVPGNSGANFFCVYK